MAVHVARAELILARPDSEPLKDLGISPDPLQQFASAFGALRTDLGESGSVLVDLLPAKPMQRRRFRRRLLREARRQHPSGGEGGGGAAVLDEVLLGTGNGRGKLGPADQVQRRYTLRQLSNKLLENDAMFQPQILIRVESEIPGRAEAHLQGFVSCFDAFAGQNYFRVAGLNLRLAFVGSDATPWRRWLFDRRFETGLFRPRRRSLLTGRELAGLLKPPTKHCRAPNVVRLGGVVPPAPYGLSEFKRGRGLLPLGRVRTEAGERLVGLPLEGTTFEYMAGRAGYGKTETALNQFLEIVRSGQGGLFLDPHEDAIQKLKPYLTEPGIAERVVEINLAGRAADRRQPGWNLFSMEGLDASYKEQRVEAVVDSFASALHWDERNNRALTLTTQAAQSLVELALVLPPELAPTIFQMTTLLSSEEWRAAALPFLSPPSQQFWGDRFERMPADAIIPVTNLIDRLRSSPAMAALLGSPRSTYNVRRAMDDGLIVLACPGSGGARSRLMANFLVYDLLHAAKTRVDLDPRSRKFFHAVLDEVQTYDGSSSGNLAALLEETRKYGVRAFLLNQDPERLTERTRAAIFTNRAHMFTSAVSARAAAMLAKEWGGEPTAATIQSLHKHTYLAEITVGTSRARPFLVNGVAVSEMWADCHHPEQLPALEETIDKTTGRREAEETIAGLNEHDLAIYEGLQKLRGTPDASAFGFDVQKSHAEPFQPLPFEPIDEQTMRQLDQEDEEPPPGSLNFELPEEDR